MSDTDAARLFRRLFQHVRAQANLPGLTPRPLALKDTVPGASEFVITAGRPIQQSGWASGGLYAPRLYGGSMSIHYAADTDQHETFGDEQAVVRALTTFGDLPAVADNPLFRQLRDPESDWFLNTQPEKAGGPPVLTLAFAFDLELELTFPPAS